MLLPVLGNKENLAQKRFDHEFRLSENTVLYGVNMMLFQKKVRRILAIGEDIYKLA